MEDERKLATGQGTASGRASTEETGNDAAHTGCGISRHYAGRHAGFEAIEEVSRSNAYSVAKPGI